jgi:excisionase family DNA binding protein
MILQSARFLGFCHPQLHVATTTHMQRDDSRWEPVSSTDLNERLAYSVDEAAAITGLSRDLLYDQMRAGKLVYLKIGRRRIITRQHLEAFLTRTT